MMPLKSISIMMMLKKENWSAAIFSFTSAMIPLQSRSSFQPKKGLCHPGGTFSDCEDRWQIAMPPMVSAETVMIAYWMMSASTILVMPPRMV